MDVANDVSQISGQDVPAIKIKTEIIDLGATNDLQCSQNITVDDQSHLIEKESNVIQKENLSCPNEHSDGPDNQHTFLVKNKDIEFFSEDVKIKEILGDENEIFEKPLSHKETQKLIKQRVKKLKMDENHIKKLLGKTLDDPDYRKLVRLKWKIKQIAKQIRKRTGKSFSKVSEIEKSLKHNDPTTANEKLNSSTDPKQVTICDVIEEIEYISDDSIVQKREKKNINRQVRMQSEEYREKERKRDNATRRLRRQSEEYKKTVRERDNEARRLRRQSEEYKKMVSERDNIARRLRLIELEESKKLKPENNTEQTKCKRLISEEHKKQIRARDNESRKLKRQESREYRQRELERDKMSRHRRQELISEEEKQRKRERDNESRKKRRQSKEYKQFERERDRAAKQLRYQDPVYRAMVNKRDTAVQELKKHVAKININNLEDEICIVETIEGDTQAIDKMISNSASGESDVKQLHSLEDEFTEILSPKSG